jgi:hypothetical protein
MDIVRSNFRTDEQLHAILPEAGNWVVNGQQGRVLGFAGSLRRAMERAADYAASGAVVVALCRLPSDNIVVQPDQIRRLQKRITEAEIVAPVEALPTQDSMAAN